MDILIVEDGTSERERLHKLFQSAGYSVQSCESVTEAEQLLAATSVRLLVLDIGLNDRSGSYLFNEVRQRKLAEHCVIFTGNPSPHLRERFLQEGATDYIVKSSREAQSEFFLQRIADLLGSPGGVVISGLALQDFLQQCVAQSSQPFFLDDSGSFPACAACGAREYFVDFASTPQMPPEVVGTVRCAGCRALLDPDIG